MRRKTLLREISAPTSRMLWGRSAGRCQLCNLPLYKSPLNQSPGNYAERAHIWAASPGGPRGTGTLDLKSRDAIANLMLVCPTCHKLVDDDEDQFSVEVLLKFKEDHERRVELAAGIRPETQTQIVTYGAPVGEQERPLSFQAVSPALFPNWNSKNDRPIDLQMTNTAARDHDDDFWTNELRNLESLFAKKLTPVLESGDHLSVFALAPQPLLIAFGMLLTDIHPAQVYQLRREPPGWGWRENSQPAEFKLRRPKRRVGPPALVLSLSATITDDRIHSAIQDASIWTIQAQSPSRDLIGSPSDLSRFRDLVRKTVDELKAEHGHSMPLHVFPAMPVSAAVDLGRTRMPKADAPWVIYDENSRRGGFVPALGSNDLAVATRENK